MKNNLDEYESPGRFAIRHGVTRQTVFNWIAKGQIKEIIVRSKRHYLVKRDAELPVLRPGRPEKGEK